MQSENSSDQTLLTKLFKEIVIVKFIFLACRPRQWTKNLLVFAAPIFNFQLNAYIWINSILTLIAFCCAASSIYLINDCIDIREDKNHPRKSKRPIASGKVKPITAIIFAIILIVTSLLIAFSIKKLLALILIAYLIIQFAYCLKLKQKPLLDIFAISSGFLLRASSGMVACDLSNSPWFLLSVGLLALFLTIEKRKAELIITSKTKNLTRSVLKRYSIPLLLRLESLVSTSCFLTYSLWAFGPKFQGAKSQWMMLTIPFVLAGIFRYQLISDPVEFARKKRKNIDYSAETPEEVLLQDNGIRLIILFWFITLILIGFLV